MVDSSQFLRLAGPVRWVPSAVTLPSRDLRVTSPVPKSRRELLRNSENRSGLAAVPTLNVTGQIEKVRSGKGIATGAGSLEDRGVASFPSRSLQGRTCF